MMVLENLNAVLEVINNASSTLTQIIGSPVELKIVRPVIDLPNELERLQKRIEGDLLITMITNVVCQQLMVSIGDLRGGSRLKLLTDARKIVVHLIFTYVENVKVRQVGAAINHDHSMAIYYRNAATDHLIADKEFRYHYEKCAIAVRAGLAEFKKSN